MNGNRVFIGNVKRSNSFDCLGGAVYKTVINPLTQETEIIYEDELVCENVVLIKVFKNKFVDLDIINSNKDIVSNVLKNNLLSTTPSEYGEWYVDEESLRPFFSYENTYTNIPKLKLEKKYNHFE